MELPVQRRRTRKCQSKLVVPIEQVDGSSSDDNETSRNNNGSDSLKAVREYNRCLSDIDRIHFSPFLVQRRVIERKAVLCC